MASGICSSPADCWRRTQPGAADPRPQCAYRTLSSVALSSVRPPALGPALTAADGSIWCVLFCDIVALCLSLLRD